MRKLLLLGLFLISASQPVSSAEQSFLPELSPTLNGINKFPQEKSDFSMRINRIYSSALDMDGKYTVSIEGEFKYRSTAKAFLPNMCAKVEVLDAKKSWSIIAVGQIGSLSPGTLIKTTLRSQDYEPSPRPITLANYSAKVLECFYLDNWQYEGYAVYALTSNWGVQAADPKKNTPKEPEKPKRFLDKIREWLQL